VDSSGDAAAVMIPTFSTVIPLEDNPDLEATVGVGFGFNSKDKVKKPPNLKDIELITAKKNSFVYDAGVKELSKEEFEQFNVS